MSVFHAFRSRGDRAPHHATNAPKDAHPRAQLAEYARIPPLITLIRPHGATHDLLHGRLQARLEHAQKARRSESSRLALPRRTRLVSSGRREGDGGRRGHSRGPLSPRSDHATDDLLTWVPPSPTRVKKSSRRRAPDAERGCPPATVVARASSPSSPEAGAAPRRPSVSQPASDGSLAPNHRSVPFLQNGSWWSWRTLTVAATTGRTVFE